MKYINKFQKTEELTQAIGGGGQLADLEHFVAYTKDTETVYLKSPSYLIYEVELRPIREIGSGNPLLITNRCDLIKTLKIDGVEQDLDEMGKERTPHVFTATTKYDKIEEIRALLYGEEYDKYIFTLNETEAFKQYKVEIEWFDNITECIYAFDECTELLSIPNDLFENCTNVTSFSYTFSKCDSLRSIPEGLFTNNRLVTDFNGTFSKCDSLRSIPEGLFTNNRLVTDFNGTFSKCGGLTSIPDNLFSTNTAVTDFSGTFSNCGELLIMPKDNDGTPIYNRSEEGKEGYAIVTIMSGCFCECEKIEGYESVPKEWTCGSAPK